MPVPTVAGKGSETHADEETVVARPPVCASCTERLSGKSGISPHRTTILRPLLHVGGTAIVESAIDQPIMDAPDAIESPAPTPKPVDPPPKSSESGKSPSIRGAAGDDEQPLKRRRVNSYDIIEEISRGSFGVVYKARQQGLDRVVALKVLLAGAHASAEAVARFHREAKAVARLKHPNIVPIYDIGTHESHHYFAMEFIEGHPLSALITEKKIATSHALAIAESLSDAFHSAHVAGVIHRDIKPSNILLDKQGQPHITDFGLAKQVDLDTKYTMSGTTLGTPAYMPPEQARGEVDRIDARSDVYAIGAVLYEMLTGQTPFAGRSLLEVVVAVISEPVRPPRQINPKIHRDVQTIVMKCLEKDPRLRYASAADLRDDLRRFRSGEAIRAKPAGLVRLGARFVRRQSALLGAIFVVLFALGFSYLRVQRATKDQMDVQQQRFKLQMARKPRWRPYWWFPAKEDAQLTEEQRDCVKFEPHCQSKNNFRDGKFPGYDLAVNGATVPIQARDTMAIPEDREHGFRYDCLGDLDADIEFRLPEGAAESGFRIALESWPNELQWTGVPFILEYRSNPSMMRVIGPRDMQGFSQSSHPLELEVKAEKIAPDLDEGSYKLNMRREGTRLAFNLKSMRGLHAAIAIDDLALTNWMFKNSRLVFRSPSVLGNIEVSSIFVQHRDVPEEETSIVDFHIGEYKRAEVGLRDMLAREDHYKGARAYMTLGKIYQITRPKWWLDNEDMFQDALRELNLFRTEVQQRRADVNRNRSQYEREEAGSSERFLAELKNAEDETDALATEIHMHRIQRCAMLSDWKGIQAELKAGWSDHPIGEPLAWSMEAALNAAVRSAQENPEALATALALYQKLGLTPGSERIGKVANALGLLLSFNGRYDDLIALHQSYPSNQLLPAFVDGIGRAMENPSQFSAAARLVKHIVIPARAAGQSRVLLKDLCSQIDKKATTLANRESFLPFTATLLPVMVAYMPSDDEALAQLGSASEKVAQALIKTTRFGDLIRLHTALRGPRTIVDARLAPAFAEAVSLLAASSDADSHGLALELLRYAAKSVAADNTEIQAAAEALARRRAAAAGDANYTAIIEVYKAYPAPSLVRIAEESMRDLLNSRRYDEAINFYQHARGELGNSGSALTPGVLAALEYVTPEQRERFMAGIWEKVSQSFAKTEDGADRAWALEYGDMQAALGQFDKAQELYQTVAKADALPEISGKASVRLAVLKIALTGEGYSTLTPLLTREKVPEEVKMAAKLLSAPTMLSPAELPERLNLLDGPRIFNAAEWELLTGIRLFEDQKSADAQIAVNSALQKSSRERSWVSGAASQFLRLIMHGPEKQPLLPEKPESEGSK